MKRIYVAGKYSSSNTLEFLNNIHDGIRASANILKQGHACFCPWLDYQLLLHRGDLEVAIFQRLSMSFLKHWATHVVYLERSTFSTGTQAEISQATALGLPIYDMTEFAEAFNIPHGWWME